MGFRSPSTPGHSVLWAVAPAPCKTQSNTSTPWTRSSISRVDTSDSLKYSEVERSRYPRKSEVLGTVLSTPGTRSSTSEGGCPQVVGSSKHCHCSRKSRGLACDTLILTAFCGKLLALAVTSGRRGHRFVDSVHFTTDFTLAPPLSTNFSKSSSVAGGGVC